MGILFTTAAWFVIGDLHIIFLSFNPNIEDQMTGFTRSLPRHYAYSVGKLRNVTIYDLGAAFLEISWGKQGRSVGCKGVSFL
jgi:hypothetical protein